MVVGLQVVVVAVVAVLSLLLSKVGAEVVLVARCMEVAPFVPDAWVDSAG